MPEVTEEQIDEIVKQRMLQRSSKGGKTTAERYGSDHMRDIQNKRWAKHRENKAKTTK